MTVEIGYFKTFATGNRPIAAHPFGSESVAISGTAGLSGATPDACEAVRITGTEAFRFEYSRDVNSAPTGATASSHYIAAGQEMWLAGRPTFKFSLRTP